MADIPFNYASQLTLESHQLEKGASGETDADRAKIVRYDRLVAYNTKLLTQLGLSTTSGEFAKYGFVTTIGDTTRSTLDVSKTGWVKATNVKNALDQLYDLVSLLNSGNIDSVKSTATTNGATITIYDGSETPKAMAAFDIVSSDANLTVVPNSTEKVDNITKIDVKSVTGTYDTESKTITVEGDTSDDDDPIAQKTYVDAAVAKYKDENAQSFAEGRVTTAPEGKTLLTDAVFTEDTSNDYYIHATVGDKVYDLKIDGDAFVKDEVLTNVKIQTYAQAVADTGEEKTWTSDDIAGFTKAKTSFNADSTQSFILFKFEEKHGSDPSTYSYQVIDACDLLTTIIGGNGIKYENNTISLDITQSDNYIKLGAIQYSVAKGELTAADVLNADTTAFNIVVGTDTITWSSNNATITAVDGSTVTKSADNAGKLDIGVETADVIQDDSTKDFSVKGSDTTTIDTATNLAEVANKIQDEIDEQAGLHISVEAKNEVEDGVDVFTVTSVTEDSTTTYTVNYTEATEAEVEGMFTSES